MRSMAFPCYRRRGSKPQRSVAWRDGGVVRLTIPRLPNPAPARRLPTLPGGSTMAPSASAVTVSAGLRGASAAKRSRPAACYARAASPPT